MTRKLNLLRHPAVLALRPLALIAIPAFFAVCAIAGETTSETPSAETAAPAKEAPKDEAKYPAALVSLSEDPHFSPYAFVVDKTERKLKVYKTDGDLVQFVEEQPTDMGKNSGDKERENDARTPIGIYFLQHKKTQPEIPFQLYGSLAFTTDYPNIFDKRIAKSGSGIWLHAVPDAVPLTRGSRGCVVVRNNVIQSLQKYVTLGQTPLIITEKIEYLTKEDFLKQRAHYLVEFEKWRKAWEESDVDTYIQFYDSTFRNSQMDYDHWYKHKKHLKSLYKFIKVQLTPPTIIRNKNQVVVRTIQDYQSDMHHDYGEKTLHAHYADDVGFKIIREDWTNMPAKSASQTSAADHSE